MQKKRASSWDRKIDWLISHSELWRDLENGDDYDNEPVRLRLWDIAETMKDHGMYSQTTLTSDIQIWNLILEAREEMERRAEHGRGLTI